MSSPRQSSRLRSQDLRNCFEIFNGNSIDVSDPSPVEALGKVSALAMLTTERVGNHEDPLMSQARPRLSEINTRGTVTTDSQMGKKEIVRISDGRDIVEWQRSYVTGLLPRHLGDKFEEKMTKVDGVIFFVGEPLNEDVDTDGWV